jgi:hypothetical protein
VHNRKTARFPHRVRTYKPQLVIDWIFERRILLHDPEFIRIRQNSEARQCPIRG